MKKLLLSMVILTATMSHIQADWSDSSIDGEINYNTEPYSVRVNYIKAWSHLNDASIKIILNSKDGYKTLAAILKDQGAEFFTTAESLKKALTR